mgnify:CR=1 FL=1
MHYDGSVYEGITISASTELDGKGSLSDSTLAELRQKEWMWMERAILRMILIILK